MDGQGEGACEAKNDSTERILKQLAITGWNAGFSEAKNDSTERILKLDGRQLDRLIAA